MTTGKNISDAGNTDLDRSQIRETVMMLNVALAQRLSHASLNLSNLGDIITDDNRLYSPSEWRKLQDMIESKYFIESDRQMLKAIRSGAVLEEALTVGEQHQQKSKSLKNIEVF